MSTTRRDFLTVKCPGCGGTFQVGLELAGRRGRCTECGTAIAIPAAPAARPAPADAPRSPGPELIGVACHVCDTPLYGTRDQIGSELTCPDCGGRTRLPAPKPKRKNIPAAMEGEQYELWDAEESPANFHEPGAARRFAINCGLCDTLMYATTAQVGSELTCPDCGSRTVVGPPVEAKPTRPVLVPAGQEYAASPAVVTKAPLPVLNPERERRVVEEDEAGRGGSVHDTERQKRAKRKRKLDARGRPILPRWPTITGVLPFLWSPGVLPRFCVYATIWLIVSSALLFCMSMLSGAGAAIMGVFLLAAMAIVGIVVVSATAAVFVAVVVESSEGSDEVSAWPTTHMPDSLMETVYLMVAVPVAALPGWGVARLLTSDGPETALWIAGSLVVCFPLVFLSQLELSSPATVLSGKVLASYGRRPLTWLVFMIESALLLAACAGVVLAAAVVHPLLLLLVPPANVLGLLLYGRMLGRLAWSIAESTPDSSESARRSQNAARSRGEAE